MEKIDLSKYSDEELIDIKKRLDFWHWDRRLGEKPFKYDNLRRYKKIEDRKYRLNMIFAAIWPKTQYDYIKPVMIEMAKRNIKGCEQFRQYIYPRTPWQRLRLWLKVFLNQHRRAGK